MTRPHVDARRSMARVLSLEVALLAAEVDLLERLVAAGIMPVGARRVPTAPELRAGVRFAALERIVEDAAARIARKTDRVREHVLDGLAEQLAGVMAEADPYAALEELDRLTDPTRPDTIPGLRAVVDDTAAAIEDDLVATAAAGHAEALDEARRQGIPDQLIDDQPLDEAEVRAAAKAHAQRVAKHPAERTLNAAAEAGGRAATGAGATGADVLEGALGGAEETSRAGTEDLARQAANVTHGIGRRQAQAALPAPAEVYASELLDSSTCGPCAALDGRQYATLTDGLVDYPGAGGYIGCEGGARCRGTLVLVHGTEAPPTRDTPGGPGGQPAPIDRTPRGPSGADRPAWIAPDGSIIPTPPDKGAPPPSDLGVALDDTGRTVVPTGVEDPIVTVAPADVARDPELARMSNDELEAAMMDGTDLERQLAAADEFDRREAGTVERVWDEEELDAATLARYEDEREAWEAAGGDVIDSLRGGLGARSDVGGRRIDVVRAAWVEEVEQQHIAAEYVTNGFLVRRDRLLEFQAKYGVGGTHGTIALFEGPARVAYYYASPELRAYWASLPGGRPSFAEFAVERGIGDAKTLARARAAREAKAEAELRADESATGQAKRQRAREEKARRRGPMTAGDRLVAEQKRRDRLRAAERRQEAEIRKAGGTIEEDPDAPTP